MPWNNLRALMQATEEAAAYMMHLQPGAFYCTALWANHKAPTNLQIKELHLTWYGAHLFIAVADGSRSQRKAAQRVVRAVGSHPLCQRLPQP